MARYDFRCSTCGTTFEVERPMSMADAPTSCPEGHEGAIKLFPVFAATGFSGAAPQPSGGGCCGGGCCG
ncbi:MAG: FmdB family zinc ribbon protein [Actinomycetota bacterium]